MPETAPRFGRAPGAWPLLGHVVALQRRPLTLLDSLPAHGDLRRAFDTFLRGIYTRAVLPLAGRLPTPGNHRYRQAVARPTPSWAATSQAGTTCPAST